MKQLLAIAIVVLIVCSACGELPATTVTRSSSEVRPTPTEYRFGDPCTLSSIECPAHPCLYEGFDKNGNFFDWANEIQQPYYEDFYGTLLEIPENQHLKGYTTADWYVEVEVYFPGDVQCP